MNDFEPTAVEATDANEKNLTPVENNSMLSSERQDCALALELESGLPEPSLGG